MNVSDKTNYYNFKVVNHDWWWDRWENGATVQCQNNSPPMSCRDLCGIKAGKRFGCARCLKGVTEPHCSSCNT